MSLSETSKKLARELEAHCPGVEVLDDECDEVLDVVVMIVPLDRGGRRRQKYLPYAIGETVHEWLHKEIERHPLYPDDERYGVICPKDGRVKIGRNNYDLQMALPDERWYCPLCGEIAMFDDDRYESWEVNVT